MCNCCRQTQTSTKLGAKGLLEAQKPRLKPQKIHPKFQAVCRNSRNLVGHTRHFTSSEHKPSEAQRGVARCSELVGQVAQRSTARSGEVLRSQIVAGCAAGKAEKYRKTRRNVQKLFQGHSKLFGIFQPTSLLQDSRNTRFRRKRCCSDCFGRVSAALCMQLPSKERMLRKSALLSSDLSKQFIVSRC